MEREAQRDREPEATTESGEEGRMNRGNKTLRIVAFGSLSIVLLIPFLIGSAWLHGAVVLALAKHEGIYASPEEGMRARIAQTWGDVDRIEIEYAGPNERDGRDPHVWFVIARVWLKGEARTQYPGSFFLQVEEGWVHVPEGQLPGLVGTWMRLFHYN
jgi:hypothetical protein